MNHPGLDRLTAWFHGLLEPPDARAVADHVGGCGECRRTAGLLEEEARAIAREVDPADRLAALKEGLLRDARAAAPRPGRGIFWQIPVAAAVLAGLVALLLSPVPRHGLLQGRVALEDGREVAAPVDFAASRPWRFRALEKTRVRLADRSVVDLAPGARIGLTPEGARGVQAELVFGEAAFDVVADPRRLSVSSSVGRVEASGGRFVMKTVGQDEGGMPMKEVLAGAIVTVFAGSVALSNANGTVEAAPGQAAVLARAEAPLFLASQDSQEALLRRLEDLAARVAKLEAEIEQLEARNRQLKAQANPGLMPGQGVWVGGSSPDGARVRVIQGGANLPGASVIIETDENPKTAPRSEKKEK